MQNNNWVIKTLVGFLFTIIFFGLTFMGSNIIANDKASRDRDTKIQEELHGESKENGKRFEKIMVVLERIQTEQRVTKELIKENGG